MSLKQKLADLIQRKGEISYQEIQNRNETYFFGKIHKMEIITRELRRLRNVVLPVENNGSITSYRWVGTIPKMKAYRVEGLGKIIHLLVVGILLGWVFAWTMMGILIFNKLT